MHKHNFLILLALSTVLGACNTGVLSDPVNSDDSSLWDIRLNHQAILMSTIAPYDTVWLDVIGRNTKGERVPFDGTPKFRSSSRSISVDSLGNVQVLAATSEAWIIAEVVNRNIRYRDSVRIRVVNQLPSSPIRSLRFIVDSAKQAANILTPFFISTPLEKQITVEALGENGDVINGAYVRFWVSDSISASVNPYTGSFRGLMPGKRVWVYAGATILGEPVLDSTEILVTDPVYVSARVVMTYPNGSKTPVYKFVPDELVVGVGGTVNFSIAPDSTRYDVQFTDSLDVSPGKISGLPDAYNEVFFGIAGGNIPVIADPEQSLSGRSFPRAGRYRYWSDSLHSEAVIVVR